MRYEDDFEDKLRRGIKVACAKRETTINKAADKCGVTPSSVYRFVNNQSTIFTNSLVVFCNDGLGYKVESVVRMGRK